MRAGKRATTTMQTTAVALIGLLAARPGDALPIAIQQTDEQRSTSQPLKTGTHELELNISEIVDSYIRYGAPPGGGRPDCLAWAALFAPNATMLSPLGPGQGMGQDFTVGYLKDPATVCRYISTCFSKLSSTVDRVVIDGPYSPSLSFVSRVTLSWTLSGLTQAHGNILTVPAFSTLFIERTMLSPALHISAKNWEDNALVPNPTYAAADAFDNTKVLSAGGECLG